MLKQFKIITLAPTCFGSRRNHHQGAVLCLAKATNFINFNKQCLNKKIVPRYADKKLINTTPTARNT